MRCEEVMRSGDLLLNASESVYDAVDKLLREGVGAAPVVGENNRYIGMLTERAIVRKMIAEGLDPAVTAVSLVVDHELPVCEPGDPVAVALKRMDEANVRWLPVVRQEELVGVIGVRDIRDAIRADDQKSLNASTEGVILH